jgi:hypothetical protein
MMKMEAIYSSETSVHTKFTWYHIPEDGILYKDTVIYDISNQKLYALFKHTVTAFNYPGVISPSTTMN